MSFSVSVVDHPNTIFSVTSAGASGSASSPSSYTASGFSSGDTVWGVYGDAAAGVSPTLWVFCNGGSVNLALYDAPAAPATFSGVATTASSQGDIQFIAPGTGQYEATVTLNQGAIWLDDNEIAGSGTYQLGSLAAGPNEFSIQGVSGPPASYTITFTPLPVQISGLSFDNSPEYTSTGSVLTASFSLSGDSTISAYVRNAAGQVVRTLGSFAASEGNSSLTWDSRGNGGAALPDGVYYLHLDSTDSNGNVTSAETAISMDNTPPSAAMTSPSRITSSQAVSFVVSDAESGVASVTVSIDGVEVDSFDSYDRLPPNGQFSDPGPWDVGPHSWAIQATDNAGNESTVTGGFTAANPTPPSKPKLPGGVFAAGHGTFQHHPSRLWLWVSDSLYNLRWANWSGAATTGYGRESRHNRGHWWWVSVQVQLSQVQVCGGRRVYTHVRYRVKSQKRWTTGHRYGCRIYA